MRPIQIFNTVVLGACLLAGAATGHGGAYRGAGDTVPPGGGNTSAPPSGSGGSAKTGSGAGGSAPGGAGPVGPGAATGPTATTPTASLGADPTTWRRWWGFNQYLHLDVKSMVYSSRNPLGSDVFFLGRGGLAGIQDRLQPNAADIHERVVPALVRALGVADDADLVTGCLVALAKIGDRSKTGRHSQRAQLLRKYLPHPNQEIAETAAICLGILGAPGAAPALQALLLDTDAGRREVGRDTGVPSRTRAFAAYGMGLLGRDLGDVDLRAELVGSLLEVLARDAREQATPDLGVACVTALGLLPLPTREAQDLAGRDGYTREVQVQWLMKAMRDEGLRTPVRAHMPVALARLVSDLPADAPLRIAVIERFLRELERGGRSELGAGYVIALGRLATAGQAALDRLARKALSQAVRSGKGAETRRFAMVALAEIAARPGFGAGAMEGLTDVRALLQERLREGRALVRPWAALSLGLLGRRLREAGLDLDPKLDREIMAGLRRARGPEEIGALAVAAGLRGIQDAVPVLLEKLRAGSTDEARGYMCLGLGMIGDRSAVERVHKLVQGAEYRPNLLRQGSLALGLLGDKSLVPELIERLRKASSLSAQASLAAGLGAIGDVRSLAPLMALLEDREQGVRARAFAAVALGLACDLRHRPWNTPLSEGMDYRANVPTLTDGRGAGILEIF